MIQLHSIKIKKTLKSNLLVLFALSMGLSSPQYSHAQNTDFDKRIGAENAKVAAAEFGIYQDKKMTAYVQGIGKRLVKELGSTPFEFQFFIADEFIPNAFALPGGYVYVTRGILALVNSEDELAGVLAHEITHVTERHSVHQMRRGIIPAVLMLPGNIVGLVSDQAGRLLNAPIAITNTLTASSYSRKQETEADTKGVALVAKAGYDPMALTAILNRLSKAIEVITEQKEQKGWLNDHPYTPDRISNITKVSKDLKWVKTPGNSESALDSLNGLICFDSPQKGIFNKSVFIHPELNFTITFPEGWKTQNESNGVAAMREDKKAAVYLGMVPATKSPEEYAKEFETELAKKHNKKPVVSEPRGDGGYLVVVSDNSGKGKETVHMHVLWIKIGEHVFKLIGIAPTMFEEQLKACAKSLRVLTEAERKNVEVRVLRVIKADAGQTLEDLVKTNGNTLKAKGLEVINGIDPKLKLEAGKQIKIIKKEIYAN